MLIGTHLGEIGQQQTCWNVSMECFETTMFPLFEQSHSFKISLADYSGVIERDLYCFWMASQFDQLVTRHSFSLFTFVLKSFWEIAVVWRPPPHGENKTTVALQVMSRALCWRHWRHFLCGKDNRPAWQQHTWVHHHNLRGCARACQPVRVCVRARQILSQTAILFSIDWWVSNLSNRKQIASNNTRCILISVKICQYDDTHRLMMLLLMTLFLQRYSDL